MEIYFKSKKLKKILTDARLIKKYYPKEFQNIINRLAELNAVKNLSFISHLPPPRRHKLKGNYNNCFAVDVSANRRLIFASFDENKTNLEDIDSIMIIGITDYH